MGAGAGGVVVKKDRSESWRKPQINQAIDVLGRWDIKELHR